MKRGFSWVICGALLALVEVGATAAESSGELLDRWLEKQSSITDWSADVTQIRSLKTLARPLSADGQIWFSQPNSFRWQLGDPPKTIAVRDDDALVVIYPRLKQVERFPLGEGEGGSWSQALALLEVGMPNGAETFRSSYELTGASQVGETWIFDLQPADSGARRLFERVRLEITGDELLLTATEIFFPDGSTMRNEFSNHRLGLEIDPDVFAVEIDPSFEVVEPMGGRK